MSWGPRLMLAASFATVVFFYFSSFILSFESFHAGGSWANTICTNEVSQSSHAIMIQTLNMGNTLTNNW